MSEQDAGRVPGSFNSGKLPQPAQVSPGAELDEEEAELELAHDPRAASSAGTLYEGPASDGAGAAGQAKRVVTPAPRTATKEQPALGAARARVTVAQEVARRLEKSVQAFVHYRNRPQGWQPVLDGAYRHLTEAARAFGAIRLEVTPYEFLNEGYPVYSCQQDRQGLPYHLFYAGVRELQFLSHLEPNEYVDFVRILAAAGQEREEDAATLLWRKNFNGLRYRVADALHEGLGYEMEQLAPRIAARMLQVTQPLHPPGAAPSSVAQQVLAQLTESVLAETQERQGQLVEALGQIDADARFLALNRQAPRLRPELWRRGLRIVLRLMELGEGVAIAQLFVQALEQLVLDDDWELLAGVCRDLAALMHEERAPATVSQARTVQQVLVELLSEDKLLTLQLLLTGCSPARAALLLELLRILPEQANSPLVRLLARLPAGEVADELRALLEARGADMTEFHGERLRSNNVVEALAALEVLKALGTPHAMALLGRATSHEQPRVRLEAWRALWMQIDESLLPQLIASLAMDHPELRDLCLGLLERQPALVQQAPRLVAFVREEPLEEWGAGQRYRLLRLLLRGESAECDEFVIKTITALNPLRRPKIEHVRQDLIRALAAHAGGRGRRLLEACLKHHPPRPVRAAIESALAQLERGS